MTAMSTTTRLTTPEAIEYPDSDGEPMAENTEQYEWITLVKGNLDIIFGANPNVFVAGDLFWYPVEGNNTIRRAPDVMVAFGRPKGRRGSYMQWLEGGIAPQVVFEILSPSNRGPELALKFEFYQTYGVEEYYIYDPDFDTLEGSLREDGTLREIPVMNDWRSPRLGIRFEWIENQLQLYAPDGQPFISMTDYAEAVKEQRRRADEQEHRAEEQRRQAEEQRRQAEEQRRRADEQEHRAEEQRRQAEEQRRQAEEQRRRADEQEHRAEEQQQHAEEQQRRAERLAAQLRALGIEPET
jgi:Uma2 family endonuclease